MVQNAPRRPGRVPPRVYWRRRATALALSIGVLSLLVWTVTGMLGGPGASGAGRRAASSIAGNQAVAGSAPATTAAGSPRTAATRAPVTPAASPADTSGHADGTVPAGLPASCAAHDVVLSLSTSQGSYWPGAQPRFEVYVVSVASRPCSVNVGPAFLAVMIRAGGTSRIWDSADCSQGQGSRFVELTRGVPKVLGFRWDRRGSAPGCRQATATVGDGTYTATALAPAAHLVSQPTIFILGGPHTGMP